MSTIKVTYSVPGTSVKRVFLDDVELLMDGSEAKGEAGPGEHVLKWEARGAQPSTPYTIKITAPPAAVFEPDPPKVTGSDGVVFALHTFNL